VRILGTRVRLMGRWCRAMGIEAYTWVGMLTHAGQVMLGHYTRIRNDRLPVLGWLSWCSVGCGCTPYNFVIFSVVVTLQQLRFA